MPIPAPRGYESEDMFIRRCMADEVMNEEFPDTDQRYAVCQQTWADRDKGASDMEQKTFAMDVKQLSETGEFEAVIATLNVVDSDGDVILPGAFGEQVVAVLPAHDSKSVPIGKGRTFEVGDEARVRGRLNLDTQAGREWYSALKFDMMDPPARQEWSFGFFVDKYRIEQRESKDVRVLERLAVHEVSPVILGAGVNTRTVAVKHEKSFSERLDAVLAEADVIADQVERFLELREGKRQTFSKPQFEKLNELIRRLEKIRHQPLMPEERALADFIAVSARLG